MHEIEIRNTPQDILFKKYVQYIIKVVVYFFQVAQLMLTGLPLWGILAILKIYQRFFQKKKEEKVEEDKDLLARLSSLPNTDV
jgi:hypothetical protein